MNNLIKTSPKRKRIGRIHHVISSDYILKPNLKVMASKKIWEMTQQLPEGSELKPYKSVELVCMAH